MIAFIIIVLYIALLCTLSNIGDCCRKNIKNKIKMKKYRKKPVVIEAVQWNGDNLAEVTAFLELKSEFILKGTTSKGVAFWKWDEYERIVEEKGLRIQTLEGEMKADVGDYIIKGVNGEFYPCKPDIFEKTYEEVV